MIGLEQLTTLIRVGAFRFTGMTKKELLWESRLKLARTTKQLKAPVMNRGQLFELTPKTLKLPELSYRLHEDSFDEMELLGFSLCTPFNLLNSPPKASFLAKDFVSYIGQTISIRGYLVTIKNTRTRTGEQMQFATFLDERGFFFDTVHWPKITKQFSFRGKGIYEVTAKVMAEMGFYSLEVESMQKMAIIPDPRFSEETDEHTIEEGRVAS
jgi:DNA polymerase-3 subunit alpha